MYYSTNPQPHLSTCISIIYYHSISESNTQVHNGVCRFVITPYGASLANTPSNWPNTHAVNGLVGSLIAQRTSALHYSEELGLAHTIVGPRLVEVHCRVSTCAWFEDVRGEFIGIDQISTRLLRNLAPQCQRNGHHYDEDNEQYPHKGSHP